MTSQHFAEAERDAEVMRGAMDAAARRHEHTKRAATAIALTWSRWVPMVDAVDAANNLTQVLSFDDSDALNAAIAAIEHRITNFNWPRLPWRTVMRMGVLATAQWVKR
jgi:hypothetical protein